MNEPINIPMEDVELEDKYEEGKFNLLQQHERIKLPILAHDIHANSKYIRIDTLESFNWDSVKQSRLIESLIVNIPVSPIILYEESYGKYKVIDGKERLKAIADFYSNKLALTGLEVNTELNGCTYVTLPIRVRSLLNHRNLSFITIIPDSGFSPSEQALLINIVAKRLENNPDA